MRKSKYTNKTLPVLLREPKILIIGGGKVGYQKAKVLTDNKIEFKIISKCISEEIKLLQTNYVQKSFDEKDIEEFQYIIDATGNDEVKTSLKKIKLRNNFLLNCVDQPEDCDFYFSSLLLYKNIKIAISSDGGSPTLTQVVRDKIKDYLPKDLSALASQKFNERILNQINIVETKKETLKLFGKVYLIGCGPGDSDLLTLKAYKLISNAEIILYDHLISEEIINLSPLNAIKICVGKEKGKRCVSQNEINDLMLNYAEAGFEVARLKSGDPYIFGRGFEEYEFLSSHDIKVEVVPGISSAFAAPLLANIPPTSRGYSSNISVVSAHLKGGENNFEWISFLKIKNHTTIVLMGLTKVNEIVNEGLKNGVDELLPVAIISNASRENQKVIVTQFKKLVDASTTAERPAILVFGLVVHLSILHARKNFIFNQI